MEHIISTQTFPPIIGEEDLKRSAVAIALTENDEIIFEVRSEKVGHQPGDICLPGGGLEEDEAPIQAVVRELMEELRLGREQIEVIAPSSIFVTGMQEIHSFLCRVTGYTGSFQREEVAEILRVPVSFFNEAMPEIYEVVWIPEMGEDFPFEKIHGGRNYGWREHKSRVRFYEYEGHVIWGITARIMEEFSHQIRKHDSSGTDTKPDVGKGEREYGKKVPYIINRKKDGMCPMEQTVLTVSDPKEAVNVLKAFLGKIKK